MFSSQDPHHQVPLGGPKTVLVTTSTGGFHMPEPLASTPTNVTGLGAERIISGSSAPISIKQIRSPPRGWEGQPPSTRAPATKKSSFGGVVTPVNVVNLYQALSNHPEREFINKRCSELREGARIGYSGPRCPFFSPNLPTAYFNPVVVTGNLTDEVSKGRTMGPFPTPPFENFQVSPIGLVPKKHSDKFETIFHLSFPKSGTSSINYFIEKDDYSQQYITIDNAVAAIQAATWAKQTLNLLFGSFRSMRMTGHSWGCFGMGSIILTKCSHLGFALPRTFLISCQMPLSGFYLTDVPSPMFATFIVEPPCHTAPLNSLCQASLSSMILTFKNLNIPISATKTEEPSQIIQFMGIILDLGKWRQGYPRIRWRGSNLLSPLSNLSGQQHCKNFNH